MSDQLDDELVQELRLAFREEAQQIVEEAESNFLLLERDPQNAQTINTLFRLIHNLKGGAKAVGFEKFVEFTHSLESYLLKFREGEWTVGPKAVQFLLKCNDHLQLLLNEVLDGQNLADNAPLLSEIEEWFSGSISDLDEDSSPEIVEEQIDIVTEAVEVVEEPQQEVQSEAPVVEVSSNSEEVSEADLLKKAAAMFSEAEVPVEAGGNSSEVQQRSVVQDRAEAEMEHRLDVLEKEIRVEEFGDDDATSQPVIPSKNISNPKLTQAPKVEEIIRVSLERVDQLINYVGELVILENVIREQSGATGSLSLKKSCNQLGKIVSEIQDISMGLRMITLKQTFQKMNRIVRDTANMIGKKVRLEIEGDETEVDKTILEQLKDPLVHLVRNAVDHGLEMPEQRRLSGKAEEGVVYLRAYHQSGRIIIEVQDDGGGIDPEKLLAKAKQKKIISPDQRLSEDECYKLLFHPGFSTKEQVTEISGRGVGLDVVKTNLESLQGIIQVQSELGKGSLFRISLPLTLSIIEGMLVRVQDQRFVVPLNHVYETVQVEKEGVHYLTGIGPVLRLRGENLNLFDLAELLNVSSKEKLSADEGTAIVVRTLEKPFAVVVDEIIGRHQVVIKGVGEQLQKLSAYSGSAIMGDGKPSLILELPELVKGKSGTQLGRKWA